MVSCIYKYIVQSTVVQYSTVFCLCLNHTHRIFCRISNNFDCPSALQVDTASMPRPSLAANESHFRCFASCTSSKISYGMRKCLRKCLRNILYSLLKSRCSSSVFLALDHLLEKSDRGWNHRVRLTRESSPSSFSYLFDVFMYTVHYVL